MLSNWTLTQLSWMIKTKVLSFEEIKILSDVDNAVVFYAHEISFGTISSCLLQIGIFKELARIWRKVIKLNQIFFLKLFGNFSRKCSMNHIPVFEQIIGVLLRFHACTCKSLADRRGLGVCQRLKIITAEVYFRNHRLTKASRSSIIGNISYSSFFVHLEPVTISSPLFHSFSSKL